MFAYTRNMQLALSDKLRRAGLAAGAGVVLALAAGFLLAALWSFLAHNLRWGPALASLAIGGGLLLIGLICLMLARKERHPVPSTEALKSEVQDQLHLLADSAIAKASDAADAAMGRAADKAGMLIEQAEQKVHSVADDLTYRANRFADHAEARVYGTVRNVGESTARRMGFSMPRPSPAPDGRTGQGKPSNAATIAPLLGALALGITLASRLQGWRHRDDPDDPTDPEY